MSWLSWQSGMVPFVPGVRACATPASAIDSRSSRAIQCTAETSMLLGRTEPLGIGGGADNLTQRCIGIETDQLVSSVRWSGVGMLICWYVDMVIYWYVSMLVCWCVGMLICWCVGTSICWYLGMLVCWCVDMLVCWYVDMLMCWCVGTLICWCVGTLICWYLGMLICWYVGMFVEYESDKRVHWSRSNNFLPQLSSCCR